MSQLVHCEVCEAGGRRRMGRTCPEGWMYIEFIRGIEWIVMTCSAECRAKGWQPLLLPSFPCDNCKKPASEKATWFCLPTANFDEPGSLPDMKNSPVACSEACAAALWRETDKLTPCKECQP